MYLKQMATKLERNYTFQKNMNKDVFEYNTGDNIEVIFNMIVTSANVALRAILRTTVRKGNVALRGIKKTTLKMITRCMFKIVKRQLVQVYREIIIS